MVPIQLDRHLLCKRLAVKRAACGKGGVHDRLIHTVADHLGEPDLAERPPELILGMN